MIHIHDPVPEIPTDVKQEGRCDGHWTKNGTIIKGGTGGDRDDPQCPLMSRVRNNIWPKVTRTSFLLWPPSDLSSFSPLHSYKEGKEVGDPSRSCRPRRAEYRVEDGPSNEGTRPTTGSRTVRPSDTRTIHLSLGYEVSIQADQDPYHHRKTTTFGDATERQGTNWRVGKTVDKLSTRHNLKTRNFMTSPKSKGLIWDCLRDSLRLW